MKTHYWIQCFFCEAFPSLQQKNQPKTFELQKGTTSSVKFIYTEHTLSYFNFRHICLLYLNLANLLSEDICWDCLWCLPQIWDKTFTFKCSVLHQMNGLLFAVKLSCTKYSSVLCNITKQLEILTVYLAIAYYNITLTRRE